MKFTKNIGFFGGVSVSYSHICGHESADMYYSSEHYAKQDRLRMETDKCSSCHNRDQIDKTNKRKLLSQVS